LADETVVTSKTAPLKKTTAVRKRVATLYFTRPKQSPSHLRDENRHDPRGISTRGVPDKSSIIPHDKEENISTITTITSWFGTVPPESLVLIELKF
jgi:hypothetical protein